MHQIHPGSAQQITSAVAQQLSKRISIGATLISSESKKRIGMMPLQLAGVPYFRARVSLLRPRILQQDQEPLHFRWFGV